MLRLKLAVSLALLGLPLSQQAPELQAHTPGESSPIAADLIVTARIGERLVGVSRAITDFSYCVYLSDLAVIEGHQGQGIGRELGAAPGDVVLGEAFTKARLTGQDLSPYRILHFATHALLPTELGQCQTEPAILTSVAPNAPSADAGFLRTGDIENLKLDADLVVLSACDTAGPGNGAGESLSGLAQAFFSAGTRGMLVTHWAAADVAAQPVGSS